MPLSFNATAVEINVGPVQCSSRQESDGVWRFFDGHHPGTGAGYQVGYQQLHFRCASCWHFFCAMFCTNHFPTGCKLRYTNFVECDLDAFACIWMLGDLVLEHLLNCGEDAKLSESSQQRETKDAWLCNSCVMCVFSSLLFPKLYKMFIIVYVVGPYVSLWLANVSS